MDARTTHILLVEDDAVDVMSVQRALAQARADVTTTLVVASNGIAALEMLRSEAPGGRRLVLLDLNMPRMGGFEFLQELRADPALRATPVVVLTTSNDERDKIEASRLNVAGYLLKPVSVASLVDLMTTLHTRGSWAELP